MGIEPFLVSSSILAVLAQRLVRVLCKACREPYLPPPETLANLGLRAESLPDGHLYRHKGCPLCMQTGYRGRTGIYELIKVDDAIRELIMRGVDSATIKDEARRRGMLTLREDGVRKMALGITSAEEVLRVTQEDFV
jgi:general secretion pathway protein E